MDTLPLTSMAKAIADRVVDEQAARDRLNEFAESLYAAVEGVLPELKAAGLDVEARRVEVEDSQRLELRAENLNERILFMTQHQVAYVLEHPGAHAALYAMLVSDVSGQAVPVERFLVSRSGEVHCEGVCAPLEKVETGAIARRLIDAMWVQARTYWTPLESMPSIPFGDIDLPRIKGQMGFRPRTTLLPPAGVRSSR
ncbi:MAG TPA: hypothetical protein VJQ09_09500 [Candidatus Limnocylindria bacterium]|nr:hypothetical protein [Candidatus Limnocylindria bacterium]